MSLFRKMFIGGDWDVAFRIKKENDGLFDYSRPFHIIKAPSNYWLADPMLFTANDKTYLFCEAYNKKKEKGELGVFEYDGKNFLNFKIVLEKNYHLSYPCVFSLDNHYYMIPESGENKTLDLYEAKAFPFNWEYRKTLLSDIVLADSTVFCINNSVMILSQLDNETLVLYSLDKNTLSVNEVQRIKHNKNGRPAGYFFSNKNHLFRPAQDCQELYGKGIIFYDVECDSNYSEKECFRIDAKQVVIDGKNPDRIHTYTSTPDLEVIDFSIFHFDLFKRLRILRRKKAIQKRKNNNAQV